MASYRFCRSDDVPLLVAAHESCYRPHEPALEPLTIDGLKRASRELGVWTSSCMVASAGTDPIAVLLAAKREPETLIWRIGSRPEHRRRGHARHLLTSLSAKLAILGPPRLLAEVPSDRAAGRALFESCGWREEREYTDFELTRRVAPAGAAELVIPVTVEDLVANQALDSDLPRCWARRPETLIRRAAVIGGLAFASPERIEAFLLFEEPEQAPRRILAVGCADPERRELWLTALIRHYAARDTRPLRFDRVHPDEIPFALLSDCGLTAGATTLGFAATAQPG